MSTPSNVGPILAWAGALIAVVVLLAIVVPIVRRALLGAPSDRAAGHADDLSSLRATLTPEEYELVRAAARRRLRDSLEPPPPTTPGNEPPALRAPPARDLAGDPLPPDPD